MKGKCPYCGSEWEEQKDGYFWCSCKSVAGGNGVYYLPLEVVEKRKQLKLKENKSIEDKQSFLDDEEKNAT